MEEGTKARWTRHVARLGGKHTSILLEIPSDDTLILFFFNTAIDCGFVGSI